MIVNMLPSVFVGLVIGVDDILGWNDLSANQQKMS